MGIDYFTFKANDTTADSNTATISFTITPVNDAPTFETLPHRGGGTGMIVEFDLNTFGNPQDIEGDSLSWSVVITNDDVEGGEPWAGSITETPSGSAGYKL